MACCWAELLAEPHAARDNKNTIQKELAKDLTNLLIILLIRAPPEERYFLIIVIVDCIWQWHLEMRVHYIIGSSQGCALTPRRLPARLVIVGLLILPNCVTL